MGRKRMIDFLLVEYVKMGKMSKKQARKFKEELKKNDNSRGNTGSI